MAWDDHSGIATRAVIPLDRLSFHNGYLSTLFQRSESRRKADYAATNNNNLL
jgi:hypothetical protein